MLMEVLDDADAVARMAAAIIAGEARLAVAARGRFVLAVSGGRTPWTMLRMLAREELPWEAFHLVQVDERLAPEGHPDRNLTHVHASLLAYAPLPCTRIHAMPVEEDDLEAAAARYAATLRELAGAPAVIDLVHLGLGQDGHTASLVPGDPVLDIHDRDVAVTRLYLGRRRMTMTFPILNRSRRILWVVTGEEKAAMLTRLCRADGTVPAGCVSQEMALVLADRAASGEELPHPARRDGNP